MRKCIIQWWKARNEAFSYMCKEDYSNGNVVLAHAAVIMIMLACGLAEWIGGLPW